MKPVLLKVLGIVLTALACIFLGASIVALTLEPSKEDAVGSQISGDSAGGVTKPNSTQTADASGIKVQGWISTNQLDNQSTLLTTWV